MAPGADTTQRPRGTRRRRTVGLVGLLAVLAVTLGGLLDPARADPITDTVNGVNALITPPPPPTTAKPRPKTPVPAYTRLATPGRTVAVYDGPNGKRVGQAGYFYGHEQSFPILYSADGWLRIRLPERPNGKTGWIKAQHVKITRTPYRMVVDLSDMQLTVYKDGYPQWRSPLGIGKDSTPTPLGSFYVVAFDNDPTPGYGPFQVATSSHSEVIQSWKGSGDAITSFHGPINKASDRQIGTTGTKISNGCLRMHLEDLQRLSVIPVGTPVDFKP